MNLTITKENSKKLLSQRSPTLNKLVKISCLEDNKFEHIHWNFKAINMNIKGFLIKKGEFFYSPSAQFICLLLIKLLFGYKS